LEVEKMKKDLKEKLKKRLEKEKREIEKELKGFAKKDLKLPEDWDTKFPKFNGETGFEAKAEEVEEYERLLPVEHALELKLAEIERALEKIKKGKYGICEKCGKEIEEKKLKANPATRYCSKCK
jgi:DnaK suppressor protein